MSRPGIGTRGSDTPVLECPRAPKFVPLGCTTALGQNFWSPRAFQYWCIAPSGTNTGPTHIIQFAIR